MIPPSVSRCVEFDTRPLCIDDVAGFMHVCRETASKIMDETGRSFVLHRKKYILPADLDAFLQKKANQQKE